MVERVEKLISNDVQVVVKSPELYMELLKLYSILFLHGKQPSDCGKCAYTYFEKIKSSGIKKAKLMENKTCKLQENKIFHVRVGNAIVQYSDYNVNDEIATKLLKEKKLSESDFIKLPEVTKEPEKVETPKAQPKKRRPRVQK